MILHVTISYTSKVIFDVVVMGRIASAQSQLFPTILQDSISTVRDLTYHSNMLDLE